jgi:2-aminoethylphosphonate transport system substrate-binding protein
MKRHNLLRAAAIAAIAATTALTAACGGTGSSGSSSGETLTVYSADGLANWYKPQFDKFTKDTGIAVNLVEAGSGEVVSRLEKEQSNPQADLLVTLPPFIQKADKSGLLVASGADTKGIPADQVGPGGNYVPIVNNALSFIVNPSANPQPKTWDDLLAPQYKGKVQYSTPGQAGDGTAVLVLLQHLLGKPGALDYLTKLQANNVGPSSSTGKLQPKVSNGELLVANGDVQMNLDSIKSDGSKFAIFFPAGADGKRTTISVPYVAGVAKGAPHEESAKKLLAFLLSDDVQKTVEPDALGIPVRDQIRTASAESPAADTPAGVLDGVDVWVPDWNTVLAELDADVAAYQKATGN